MAGFKDIKITKQGAILAAKTIVGKIIEFSHIEVGEGTYTGDIKEKTALTTKIMQCEIIKVKQKSDTEVAIAFLLKNTEVPKAFYFREIGLFAIDPDTKEKVLFAYSNAGNKAEYINNSISEKIEKYIDIIVTVDNASNVNITLDENEIYVTEKKLEETLEQRIYHNGVNVKEYGAIGDGVADDTIAIQKAIDKNDSIFFPEGTYKISELEITSNKNIKGLGAILKGKAINVAGSNNYLYDIKYDGNLDCDGISITGDNNTIDNCEIYNIKNIDGNLGKGIDARNCNHITIKNCYFHDLFSGNEDADVGIDEGAIRAIRTYGCDYVDIYNNRFEQMSGHKDGDYVHIAEGTLGEADENFPYLGTTRYTFKDIRIHNNIFIQKDCKSSIKTQASNVNIYNNKFTLENITDSHYSVVRVYNGDNNNVYNNHFNILKSATRYNHIILFTNTANGTIKNNIFNVDITEEVVSTSSQDIFEICLCSNININDNTIMTKDIRYIFYVDSSEDINIVNNNFNCNYSNYKATLLRVLNTREHVSKNINFSKNYYYEYNSSVSSNLMNIDPVENINIYNNYFHYYGYGPEITLYNTTNLHFEKNILYNSYEGEQVFYPITFYENCQNLYVKNNENNKATAFIQIYAVVVNLHFSANGNFESGECIYNRVASEQDLNEYHYYKSDHVSQNYDFGYNPKGCIYQNGHTYYNRTLMKLVTYFNGKWYLDGSEYTFS